MIKTYFESHTDITEILTYEEIREIALFFIIFSSQLYCCRRCVLRAANYNATYHRPL